MKVGDLVRNKYRKGTEGHPIGIVTKTPESPQWTKVYWLRGNWAGTEQPLPTYHLEVINDD